MESPFSTYLRKEQQRRLTDKRPTVMFAMPHYGIAIHRLVYESHLSAVAHSNNQGVSFRYASVGITNKMSLAAAENELVRYARGMKPDFIFWTEQDMVLPTSTISHLVEQAVTKNLDIVSGVYFLRGTGQPCLYKQSLTSKEHEYAHAQIISFPKNALFEVGCPGMGCVLMRASIFEGLDEPWFDDQEGKCGTDMYFYTRARRKGFRVWADSRLLVDQIDEDEPRLWSYRDYQKWLKKSSHRGGYLGAKLPIYGENASL